MGIRELSASEFIHGLFISKKLSMNKITAPYDRAQDLPTGNKDGSTAVCCQLLAAFTWGDSWSHCIHMDQICLGLVLKKSPETQQGQNSRKGKVQKSLLASVWTSHGCSKEKLSSVPEPFLILWKWLLDATAQLIISSSFLARFW